MKRLSLIPFIFILFSFTGDSYQREVKVKTPIFEVLYSEVYEQPLWLIYESTNRPTKVNRGSMDFYTDKVVNTSDSKDYYRNVYDKGHLAPAATFSDNMENLKQTFSYLNCSLQNQDLNRGEWRFLEERERKWDDSENLKVKVELVFEKDHIVLPTGGHVPTSMVKHIYFSKQNKWKCFDFPNIKPIKGWEKYEVKHIH